MLPRWGASPRLGWWSAILLPAGLICNGWIIEALFARGMQFGWNATNNDSFFTWWEVGDWVLQWLMYGPVAWLLLTQRLRWNATLTASNGFAHPYRRASMLPAWVLVLILLFIDYGFRQDLNAPWLWGTQFEPRLSNGWLFTASLMPDDAAELNSWLMARFWWGMHPVLVFLHSLLTLWTVRALRQRMQTRLTRGLRTAI